MPLNTPAYEQASETLLLDDEPTLVNDETGAKIYNPLVKIGGS